MEIPLIAWVVRPLTSGLFSLSPRLTSAQKDLLSHDITIHSNGHTHYINNPHLLALCCVYLRCPRMRAFFCLPTFTDFHAANCCNFERFHYKNLIFILVSCHWLHPWSQFHCLKQPFCPPRELRAFFCLRFLKLGRVEANPALFVMLITEPETQPWQSGYIH